MQNFVLQETDVMRVLFLLTYDLMEAKATGVDLEYYASQAREYLYPSMQTLFGYNNGAKDRNIFLANEQEDHSLCRSDIFRKHKISLKLPNF